MAGSETPARPPIHLPGLGLKAILPLPLPLPLPLLLMLMMLLLLMMMMRGVLLVLLQMLRSLRMLRLRRTMPRPWRCMSRVSSPVRHSERCSSPSGGAGAARTKTRMRRHGAGQR